MQILICNFNLEHVPGIMKDTRDNNTAKFPFWWPTTATLKSPKKLQTLKKMQNFFKTKKIFDKNDRKFLTFFKKAQDKIT